MRCKEFPIRAISQPLGLFFKIMATLVGTIFFDFAACAVAPLLQTSKVCYLSYFWFMSLVSIIGNYGGVVMLSDLAISAQNEPFRSVVLPVRNLETAREDFPDRFIVSLRQKMIIIKDRMLIGATGDEQAIRELFIAASDYFIHLEISEANLNDFIQDLLGGRTQVDFSALFALPSDNPSHIVAVRSIGAVLTETHPSFDSMRSIGTGAEEWNRYFSQQAPYFDGISINPSQILLKVLTSAMYFLDEERQSPDNLQNGWGGFLDFVYFDSAERHFKRPDKIGYGFWAIDIGADQPHLQPLSLLRAVHTDHNFYIQHYSFQPQNYRVYLIPEIHRVAMADDAPLPFDFDCQQLASAVHIYRSGERCSTLFTIDSTMPSEPTLLISQEIDGYWALGWSQRLTESLLQKVLASL
jgi:hypothetical protein